MRYDNRALYEYYHLGAKGTAINGRYNENNNV